MPEPTDLSPAALLLLYPEGIIPPDRVLTEGFQAPCSETKLSLNDLAGELFAISFWNLRERKALGLDMGKKTLMGMGKQQITATLAPGATAPQQPALQETPTQAAGAPGPGATPEQWQQWAMQQAQNAQSGAQLGETLGQLSQMPGMSMRMTSGWAVPLEDGILQILQARDGEAHVRDVIRDWFGSDSETPYKDVTNPPAQELLGKGFGTPQQQTGWIVSGTLATTKLAIEVDCGKRETVKAAADDVLGRYRTFKEKEGPLAETLMERCKSAVHSRQYSDSTD